MSSRGFASFRAIETTTLDITSAVNDNSAANKAALDGSSLAVENDAPGVFSIFSFPNLTNGLYSGWVGSSADYNTFATTVPIDCTMVLARAYFEVAPGSGSTHTVEFWKNGADTGAALVVSDSEKEGTATPNIAFSAGDTYAFRYVQTGSGTGEVNITTTFSN